MSHDYSGAVQIMPLRWDASDAEFAPALDAMLADFVKLLAEHATPMSEEDVQDLRDEAGKYRAKVRAQYVPGAKRFTDAELAAECHAATLAVYRAKVHQQEPPLEQMVTVRRFALLPHYDEACK